MLNKSRLIKICFLYFIGIIFSSCVTLQNNFIATKQAAAENKKPVSDPERKKLNQEADSILRKLSSENTNALHIKADDLNKIYTTFSRQLDYDRYYNSILQKGQVLPDTLTSEQCLASIILLSSAADYDKSYYLNKKIRRALNRGNYSNNIPRNTLQKSNEFLYSPEVRERIENCAERKISSEFDSLYKSLPQTDYLKAAWYWLYRGNERISSFVYDATGAGSYAFGNTVGAFNKKIDQVKSAEKILPCLKPYDIIISKSPQHLTDKFIPGYFGHAAIWFGDDITRSRFSRNNRIIKNPQNSLLKNTLVEALRSGVKVSSLEEFADGEVYLVIRIRNLTDSLRIQMMINARQQIGKPYDFNFDIESSDAITCTELVFLACDFIDWKVRYTLGRFTLSPDDLLLTALENKILEIPYLISGDKVTVNPNVETLKSLLKQN